MIVICWTSERLLEMIYSYGGSSVRSAINEQLGKKHKNVFTSVQADGDIKSKRIYIIHWRAESQIDLVKKSLEDLISVAMQRAYEDNYRSIAFPAFGCGDYKHPVEVITKTMVKKAHQEQVLYNIAVSFIIQSTQQSVFHHFEKHPAPGSGRDHDWRDQGF